MDAVKINKQNETLIDEVQNLEKRIREEILSHDQSEFAEDNVEYGFNIYLIKKNLFLSSLSRHIIQLLKKVDVLHVKKLISGDNDNDDRYFLHTYDDYFS